MTDMLYFVFDAAGFKLVRITPDENEARRITKSEQYICIGVNVNYFADYRKSMHE